MASRQVSRCIDPAVRPAPPSLAHGLLGLLVGCLLLAAATWLGTALRDDLSGIQPQMQTQAQTSASALKIIDTQRALIFDADARTGDVHVLSVRSGISEIARLHEAPRRNVSSITLDSQGTVLTVVSGNERYQYDTHSFRLLRSSPVLAAGGGDGTEM